jgi:hypothetical protein
MYETVYYNNGDIYKETNQYLGERVSNAVLYSKNTSTGVEKKFYKQGNIDSFNEWNFFSINDSGNVKRYYKSPEICNLEDEEFTNNVDISTLDIFSGIKHIISFAKSVDNIEMFFDVEDESMLYTISEYYMLPFPLKEVNSFDLDRGWYSVKSQVSEHDCKEVASILTDTKLCSIKFINGKALFFKAYFNVFS